MGEGQEIRLRDVTKDADKATDGEKPQMRNSIFGEKTANGGGGVVSDKHDTEEEEQGRCSRLQEICTSCCMPCLTSDNPLPENPNIFQRLKHSFMLPPHGNLAFYIQFAVVMLQIWIVLFCLTHAEALPGGNFYSLLILFICCAIGGYLISFANLPPLLGMLIMGLLLRNLPGVKYVGEHIDTKWSGALRKIALTVILTRAGLGLDIVKLRKLSFAVLRLALLPCAAEIITVGIVSRFLLGFPWVWSMMMGCILGALSPAVTVPSLVSLQDRRYGVAKGIPTMLLAAGGLDNVLCVTGFSVFMGIIFSDGDLIVTIIKGPIGVIVGIIYGFIAGIFLWYFPSKDCGNPVFYRSLMLISAGLIAIFGSSLIGLSGAGPLGCLSTATVAAYKWRQRRQPGETDEMAGVMALTWLIMQHFLFGLIGTAVNVSHIQSNTAGLGIGTLAIGLLVRSIVSSTVTMGTGFNWKERLFITLTWLSKATVQAAIGGLALDKVMESDNPDPDQKNYATDILTISVLAIIICAPTGATLMAVLGPKFLVQGDDDDVEVDVKHDEADKEERISTAVTETVEVISEKDSLRGSRSSLDNEFFKSELSLVLQNRKKSESDSTGIVNPAFDDGSNANISSSTPPSPPPPPPAPTPPPSTTVTETDDAISEDNETKDTDNKKGSLTTVETNDDEITKSNDLIDNNTAELVKDVTETENGNLPGKLEEGRYKTVLDISKINGNVIKS